ncbi:hypothetical protein AU255_16760 [Methyloprofundus sedimenti]|uniref:Capsular biosynthesis protein n=1 Tax=Methyloprofundus sedimenti TaxID=1420851 RepID=A0A1V8M2R8_9GAMM|nr:hypothetical protein [Methyloprofundus sedimenti]OQK15841.1 hypothetical protein AU255_16760 [Methyloprofundus sedimenti]
MIKITKNIKKNIRKLLIPHNDKLINFLIFLGVRPIVFIDSDIGELDWLDIPRQDIYFEGIKKIRPIISYRVPRNIPTDSEGNVFTLNSTEMFIYRDVNLFSVVEYSVYVSLEIAKHEFDINNDVHYNEIIKWLRLARMIVDNILDFLKKTKPSSVVIMQGYFIETAIVRQLSDIFYFQVFTLENTFNYERIICEPLSEISVNKTSIMSWFYKLSFKNINKSHITAESWVSNITKKKHITHQSPTEKYQWLAGKKRLLFLGQCFTDSSLLFGWDRNYSTVEIFSSLKQYAMSKDCHLFIKFHPKEFNGLNPLLKSYDQLTYKKICESGIALSDCDNVTLDYINQYSTTQLIQGADVVITINSQAGLEALALGKEVVLLNQAFYDQLGCTWNIPHLSVIDSCLDAILYSGVSLSNKKVVDTFFNIYFSNYCIKRHAQILVTALLDRQLQRRFFSTYP